MSDINTPNTFDFLLSNNCIAESDILKTSDDFFVVDKSISEILAVKNIFEFLSLSGEKFKCSNFFDDWYLYAILDSEGCVYSLLKLREQENDAKNGSPADGDTPGVTISFISFNSEILIKALVDASDENLKNLNVEINRVVAFKGQRHHKALKKYFKNPLSNGAYLVADLFIKHIASFANGGVLSVPKHYKEIVQQSISYKFSAKLTRVPYFIESLNTSAGRVICDNKNIYIKNNENLDNYEALAILATHTGNVSVFSFAAEVEYHARFLIPVARVKLPFFRKSIYDSAIRADMSIDDTEFEGHASFYKLNSKIVKRQYDLHKELRF